MKALFRHQVSVITQFDGLMFTYRDGPARMKFLFDRSRRKVRCRHKTLGGVLRHARPPWTSHPPTGQACGRPLRGPWLDHRSSADAFGLTRFACQTAV